MAAYTTSTGIPLSLGQAIISGLIIVAVIIGLAKCSAKLDQLNEDGQKYAQLHNCLPDGFVGKNATPIYRCDTGVFKVRKINVMGKELLGK